MTPFQISALMGQWLGAALCLGAIIVCAVGIQIEIKQKAPKGFLWITIGMFLGMTGSFIYAIATKMLGF